MTRAVLTLAASAVVFAVAAAGMLRGDEPWATWFYVFAWYPTLLAADAVMRLRTGRWHFVSHPRFAASLLLWSIPFWLFFEWVNFRVANWYYVFLPAGAASRWTGIVLSFATVLPAIVVSRHLMAELGVARDVEWRPLPVPAVLPVVLQLVGVAFFAFALAWPRFFFPLVWGGVTLLVDPWVYRRDKDRSLLGRLERGTPAVIVQLLVGGLLIGFLWELYNTQARGKWIYTVPGLEEFKLFEMPLLGFLGFPVLALDGWAVWNALVLAGLGTPATSRVRRGVRPSSWRIGLAAVAGFAFSVAVLTGMERRTITSLTPSLRDVTGSATPLLEDAGYDVFSLADADPAALEAATGDSRAHAWVRDARLVTLRGIGTVNAERLRAAGVASVETLASADPDVLTRSLAQGGAAAVRAARVRVWIRGAQGLR